MKPNLRSFFIVAGILCFLTNMFISCNSSQKINVSENGKKVWENGAFVTGNPGITDARIDEDCLTFSIGSGTYEFKLSGV